MIIGAYYFALVDFIEDTCPTVPGCDHVRYVEPLVSLMIKIQHYNVGFKPCPGRAQTAGKGPG